MQSYPDLSIEKTHGGLIAGIDEAGRGPLAGPVVAAAVILNETRIPRGIHDSKQLTALKRERLFDVIRASARCGIGMASVAEIDRLNILGATKLAMIRAYEALAVTADLALIDGNQPPSLPCRTLAVVGGDAKSLSIAAASILAKVTRDRLMQSLAQEFPHYGWERNAGYGTRGHLDAMERNGICREHRTSFAPVRTILERTKEAV